MTLKLTPEQAERFKSLGRKGNHGKRRVKISHIKRVKHLIKQGASYKKIMTEVPICKDTVSKIKRGVYDRFMED